MYYYQSRKDDHEVIDILNRLADKHPTEGFWQLFDRLRKQGHPWNHKRVYRVYKSIGMNLKRKRKRRLPARVKQPLEVPSSPNHTWSADFVSDSLITGRKFRAFNLIDDFNREILAIEIDTSLPAERIIRVLEKTIFWRGKPQRIRTDNGPEFISNALKCWCEEQHIELAYIQPGKPMQNSYIERFNGTYRRDILDAYLFDSLESVRKKTSEFAEDYNLVRGHDSLSKLSPVQYLKYQTKNENYQNEFCKYLEN